MNVTIPKVTVNDRNTDDFTGRIAALNETVNTEAFSSPRSDLFTSSPHTSNLSVYTSERGTSVINVSPFNAVLIYSRPFKLSLFFAAVEQCTSFN